ncbi:MAG: hypothetical protein HYY40_06605 [Bacteroidetes bacterium]|nr:hypothetical protein [Bacteroidota bacterium]
MINIPIVFNICLLLLSGAPFLYGQDAAFDPAGKKKTDQEVYADGSRKYHNVLLVPYRPNMHLPDPAGDVELSQSSGKEYKAMRNEIRSSLDFYIAGKIRTSYKVVSLMSQQTMDAKNDLEMIYGAAGYRFADSKRAKRQANVSMSASDKIVNAIDGLTKPKPHKQFITKGELTVDTTNHDIRFLEVYFSDLKIIPYLANRYGADLFVFISLVEIKKQFPSSADVPYRNYYRVVKVSYSVYDKEAQLVAGDVAVTAINDKTDDIKRIMDETFPLIAEMIISDLPKPDMSTPEMKLEKENMKKAEERDLLKNR